MSDINVVYKGSSIATMDATGNKTIETGGKYCEDDITIEYTRPSGGGGASENAVNFIDYDGTIVQSYSASDFANLSAMPENPSHAGLTAQGWNWELSDAKTYVAKYGLLDIGQMYITDDGKTRIYIHLEEGRISPMLGVCVNGTVDVDWGDNTAHDTLTGSSAATMQWTPNHEYSAPGDYVIKLSVIGSLYLVGESSENKSCALLRANSTSDLANLYYLGSILKVELGNNITEIGKSAFQKCLNLRSITVPKTITDIKIDAFYNCRDLEYITIPENIAEIGDTPFRYCSNLKKISLPKSTNQWSYAGAFRYCNNIDRIVIPEGVTSFGQYAFESCYALRELKLPESLTTIGQYAFQNCYSLNSIAIPENVTNIGTYAFNACGTKEYHLLSLTPPTLASSASNVFGNRASDCVFYVPAGSLETYQTASNWSNLADSMAEEPA